MKLNKRLFIVMIDDMMSTCTTRKILKQMHYEWAAMTKYAILNEGLIDLKRRVKAMPDGAIDVVELIEATEAVMNKIGDTNKYLMDVVIELYNGGEVNAEWE